MTTLDKITKGMRITNALLFLPFMFFTMVVFLFAVAGLAVIENQNPELLDEAGGFVILWDLLNAYPVLFMIFFITFFFWWNVKRKNKVMTD